MKTLNEERMQGLYKRIADLEAGLPGFSDCEKAEATKELSTLYAELSEKLKGTK